MIDKNYKRRKPYLWNREAIHTCHEGHDCEERWTVGHHLAEAIDYLDHIGIKGNTWSIETLRRRHEEAIHHIRKAWDKNKSK